MMKLRPSIQILLLITAMQLTSGYAIRCWIFCTDQTAIQNDYVHDRNGCRDYAELRIQTDTASPELIDEKERKSKLVSLFSSCMADKGWTVPDGKGGQQAAGNVPVSTGQGATPAPAPVAAATPKPAAAIAPIMTTESAAALAAKQREKTFLRRSSECSFARSGAAYSKVAATRAQACDIECKQRMKATPGAPRPAACPADPNTIGKEDN